MSCFFTYLATFVFIFRFSADICLGITMLVQEFYIYICQSVFFHRFNKKKNTQKRKCFVDIV